MLLWNGCLDGSFFKKNAVEACRDILMKKSRL
jgi:hypothetical protein